MVVLVLDPSEQANVIRRRKESDCDRFDEVWDGVYVVSPNPNLEHQGVGTALATILSIAIEWTGLGHVFQGVNVSDREDDWEHNYRIPDVAVYLQGNPARACVTHWFGGPDLAFEIVSPNDRCREKLPFYANIRTRELMIVDRDPWALELYRLQGDTFVLIGTSDLAQPTLLASAALPMSFRLVPGAKRPRIEVVHANGVQRWLV